MAVSSTSYDHVTVPTDTLRMTQESYFRFSHPISGFQFIIAVITIFKGTKIGVDDQSIYMITIIFFTYRRACTSVVPVW